MLAKGVQSSKVLPFPVAFCNELKIKYLCFVVSAVAALRYKNRCRARFPLRETMYKFAQTYSNRQRYTLSGQ